MATRIVGDVNLGVHAYVALVCLLRRLNLGSKALGKKEEAEADEDASVMLDQHTHDSAANPPQPHYARHPANDTQHKAQ